MYSFAFLLSTPKKFQPCFQSFFPCPLSFPIKEKNPGNKVDSPKDKTIGTVTFKKSQRYTCR